jgi:CBS domain-containing membrane protein
MRRRWRPLLAGTTGRDRALACLGALIGIAATAGVARATGLPLPAIVAPMGASAVLVFAVPASPLAQPWPVIAGNTLSALVGIAAGQALGAGPLAAGVAVGVAILAMSLTRCLHPPGGAAALTAVIGGPAVAAAGWRFALAPVALNSLTLVACGLLFHRFAGHRYPHRAAPIPTPPRFLPQDIDTALAEAGEAFDIDPDDLAQLLAAAEAAADRRTAGAR